MDDDAVWADFIDFIGRAPAAQHPGVLFEGFRDDLVGRGCAADDAAGRMQRVMALSRQRSDWAGPMFDRIYTAAQAEFRLEPNDFLVRVRSGRPPGRALDVAMGQGRNAVYLAEQGWDVTGFDLSAEGLVAAERAADERGCSIETVLSSSEAFDYGTSAWDLIVLTYAVVPVTAPDYAATLMSALRPGGLLVLESFAVDESRPRRPVDVDADALQVAYSDLHQVAYELGDAVADWTMAPALIVRFAAERSL